MKKLLHERIHRGRTDKQEDWQKQKVRKTKNRWKKSIETRLQPFNTYSHRQRFKSWALKKTIFNVTKRLLERDLLDVCGASLARQLIQENEIVEDFLKQKVDWISLQDSRLTLVNSANQVKNRFILRTWKLFCDRRKKSRKKKIQWREKKRGVSTKPVVNG